MRLLSTFKISTKLYALILLAGLAMATIATISSSQTDEVYRAANYTAINLMPSFNALYKIRGSFRKIQIASRDHILSNDESEKTAIERTIADERKIVVELLEEYEAHLISSAEDRKLLDADRVAYRAYETVVDTRIGMSRRDNDGEAFAFTKQAKPTVAALEDALQKHIDFNERLSAETSANSSAIKAAAFRNTVGITAAAFLALLAIGWLIANRGLSQPIGQVAENLIALAGGSLDVAISGTERRDEVGDIARAAQVFKNFVVKLDAQGWVKTNEAKIAATLQQAATIQDLAQQTMSMLCPLVNAQHGLFYVLSDDKLEMRGRYGYRERKHLNTSFAIGEGLVGQCAMDRKPITLTRPPEDYIQISSGLGEATPAVIAVLPIIQADALRGVVELAAFSPFGQREMALLDELMPALGTYLELLERSIAAQTLLKETQEQAARMEAQAAQLEEQSVEMEAQQAELAATEAWYRSIITKAPDGALVVDGNGIIVLSNTKAEELFGYDAGKMDGMSVDKLVPLSARGDHHKNRDGFMIAGGSRRMGESLELTGVRADGSEFAIEIGLSRLPDVGGRGTCAYASIRDVTEKQKAQAEIKFANMMSDSALELTTAGYWRIDYSEPDYYISSERTAAIFGEDPRPGWRFHLADEWLTRIAAADPAAAEETTRLYQAALNGETPFYDAIYPYKRPSDGRVIWTRAIGKIERDEHGKPRVMYGVNQDITQAKLADEKIKENEKRFRGLFESSRDALFILLDGKYIDCNQAALELFGLNARQDLFEAKPGSLAPEVQPNGENSREYASRMFAQAMQTGTTQFEWTVKRSDGTLVPTEIVLTRVDYGGIQALFSSVRDITNRKRAERAMAAARDAAEAATKAKGEFLASMSHEIRTPMNGITGMADLLAQTKLDDDQKHMLKTIRESGNALITVINDILDFSKIEAGKLDFEDVSMSVADALEGVASTLTPTATKKGVRIDTYVDPEIPEAVHGDAVRVRQILFNLTGNAVKFSDNKDVAVRATVARTDDDGRMWVRFDVIDHGIGISEEGQAKLFQAFSQAESSTTRKFGGTGLGLAICKRLVEMMGGTVGLKSKLGEGSVFTAELPFKPSEQSRSREKPRDLHGLRVLLLGSDGMRSEAIVAYLSHWGADVTRAPDDSDAIEQIKRSHQARQEFSSVLIDLGLDAARQHIAVDRIRAAFPERKTPLILMQDFQTRGPRIKEEDLVTIDANPLIRYRVVTAVAVAAGRASPQVRPDVDEATDAPKKAPSLEEALAARQLILLAEDNLTNQDVIRRQLSLLGFACEIANNGAEALKAWRTGRHVLLLTDCHMPEMDGYELTGSIRTEEKPSGKRMPIVAVTANALQGEAERCIAAGMDDYISKPIAMPALRAVLKKWMPDPVVSGSTAQPAPATGTPASTIPEASAGPAIDDRAIKDMFGDDQVTFKEILSEFLPVSRAIVADITAAAEGKNAKDMANAAHKLKSAARSVGAVALADICVELESAGKAGDLDVIVALAPKVPPIMDAVAAYIEAL